MLHAFIFGFVLTFGLIIPLGMQNVFIFNQGATQAHFLHALPSVITAALCDIALIGLAVLGVSVAILAIPVLKIAIFTFGFFFLLYMGFLTWRAKPSHLQEGYQPLSAKKQIAFSASVSLLNPHAIVDTIGVIGTNSLNFVGVEKIVFALACMLVSCGWFISLSFAGHFMHRLDKSGKGIVLMNKVSALIIWGIAGYMGYQVWLAWR